MNLTRSTPLPSHSFPDEGEVRECEDCGAEWDTSEYDDPPPWPCRRSPLGSSSGPAPVSDRRSEKRSSSVTGEKLQMGPVCDWIRKQRCFLARDNRHTCEKRPGRAAIETCHLDRRGKGFDDWRVIEGEVRLRVAPGCPPAHDALDEHRDLDGIPHELIEARAEVEAVRLQKESPVDPPEHYQLKANGELL